LRDFIITLNTGKTKADALRYDMDDKALRIYVTPKSGFFEASDVTTTAGTFAYDTIVTLDLPNLENLGELHRSNAEFFYHTPVINIDHNSANTRYGHINLVDLTASSVSEIIFGLIKTLNEQWLDEHIATNLLTGIISKTKTFQNQGVTPRSLAIASHLMAAGARRDEIIRNLYQTKNIPTLQLWGRALAKIQSTADGKIVWSVLNKEDLVTTGGNPMMAAGVLDELMINTPQAEFVGLVVEVDGGAQVFIVAEQPFATPLPAPFELSSPTFAAATVKGAVSDGQQQLLTVLGAK
jgi:nanoRNase/pAp phosphatase (c-di-AMP/oligoRNAs hydrolase)